MESIASSMCNSIKFPRFSLIFSISQDFCVWYLFEFTVPFFRFTFIEQNFRFGFLFFFVSFKAMQLRIMSDCLVVTYQQDQEKRGSSIHFAVSWISQSRSEPIHFQLQLFLLRLGSALTSQSSYHCQLPPDFLSPNNSLRQVCKTSKQEKKKEGKMKQVG